MRSSETGHLQRGSRDNQPSWVSRINKFEFGFQPFPRVVMSPWIVYEAIPRCKFSHFKKYIFYFIHPSHVCQWMRGSCGRAMCTGQRTTFGSSSTTRLIFQHFYPPILLPKLLSFTLFYVTLCSYKNLVLKLYFKKNIFLLFQSCRQDVTRIKTQNFVKVKDDINLGNVKLLRLTAMPVRNGMYAFDFDSWTWRWR